MKEKPNRVELTWTRKKVPPMTSREGDLDLVISRVQPFRTSAQ